MKLSKSLNLWTLFLATILTACNSTAQKINLSVQEFEKGIQQNNAQILDVRTAEEYQSGHLAKAFLADWTDEKQFKERIQHLDKSKPVYTYCLSGTRSSSAAEWLNKNGYTAYNLAGGIIAWKKNNKPVEAARVEKQMSMTEYLALIPADKIVLVDFSAVWCLPCKKMEPVLESLQQEYKPRFVLVKIDGGVHTDLCNKLKIDNFPTFLIYKQGKEVWRKSGVVEQTEFLKEF